MEMNFEHSVANVPVHTERTTTNASVPFISVTSCELAAPRWVTDRNSCIVVGHEQVGFGHTMVSKLDTMTASVVDTNVTGSHQDHLVIGTSGSSAITSNAGLSSLPLEKLLLLLQKL